MSRRKIDKQPESTETNRKLTKIDESAMTSKRKKNYTE